MHDLRCRLHSLAQPLNPARQNQFSHCSDCTLCSRPAFQHMGLWGMCAPPDTDVCCLLLVAMCSATGLLPTALLCWSMRPAWIGESRLGCWARRCLAPHSPSYTLPCLGSQVLVSTVLVQYTHAFDLEIFSVIKINSTYKSRDSCTVTASSPCA